MKKQFKLMALASAVLLLGACADEDVLTPQQARDANPESNAIEFGTYMGKSTATRAGYTGGITTDILKGAADGFGVFAYYTEKNTYGEFMKKGAPSGVMLYNGEGTRDFNTNSFVANFMYNQQVKWNNSSTSTITSWEYSPIKYWPNEVSQNDVDDQNNDTNNDPATAPDYKYGGNVSFFAYAPYVDVEPSDGEAESGAYSAFSGTAFEGNSGILSFVTNTDNKEPLVAYKIPKKGETVDLLWGTKGNTDMNVNNVNNAGKTGDGNASNDDSSVAGRNYTDAILGKYSTNADLTKQTTTGTVDFLFKHATSKVGGSYTGDGEGDDEDVTTPTNGLMVILDLDLNGNETGGQLEKFATDDDMYVAGKTENKTKVTIKTITIESNKSVNPVGTGVSESGNTITIGTSWPGTDGTLDLHNQGVFNLATGQWSNQTTTTDFYDSTADPADPGMQHVVVSETSTDDEKGKASATLSNEIAEKTANVSDFSTGQTNFKETQPIGVTTVPKNVYEGEASPLVFLPDQYPILHVTVEYVVRTYDKNLQYAYSEVTQKIKKQLVFLKKTELNKQYNILMHLGLTSVKFTATVSNWDSSDLTVSTTTDPGTGDIVPLYQADEDVYLPINVEQNVQNIAVSSSPALTDDGSNYKIELSSKAGTLDLAVSADLKSDKGEENNGVNVTNEASYVPNVSWIHVTSAGDVTVDEYTAIGAGDRTGTITVTYGDKTKVITVTQKGRSVTALTLTFNDGTTNVTGKADEYPYTLIATVTDNVAGGFENTAYNATTEDYYLTSNQTWATIDKATKKVAIKAYTGSDETRTATLTAKFYGFTAPTVTVIQSKSTLADIGTTATTTNLLISHDGGTATKIDAAYTAPAKGEVLTAKSLVAYFTAGSDNFTQSGSNIVLSTTSTATWFTVNSKTITIKPETTGTAHSAETIKVTFKDENGVSQEKTFTIAQSAGTLSSISATLSNGETYTANADVAVPAAGATYSVGDVVADFSTFTRDAVADLKVTLTENAGAGGKVSFSTDKKTITFAANNTNNAIEDVTLTITVEYSSSNKKTIVLTFKQPKL